MQMLLHTKLKQTIERLEAEADLLDTARRQQLIQLAQTITERKLPLVFNFICTHNSRRSHMGQLWAQAAAYYFKLNAQTYSGGTEATAFNPSAIQALTESGFQIEEAEPGTNPHYLVSYGPDLPTTRAFSKTYDDAANPSQNFIAILTCTSADEACPIVFGAGLRAALPYEDPKKADGSPQEAATYRARAEEIGREMIYLFSEIKKLYYRAS
jgi:protein-tyrosine-phosphatase